jgi:hypothetical protein
MGVAQASLIKEPMGLVSGEGFNLFQDVALNLKDE